MSAYPTSFSNVLGSEHADENLLRQGYSHVPVSVPTEYIRINNFFDALVSRYAERFKVYKAPVSMTLASVLDPVNTQLEPGNILLVGDTDMVKRTVQAVEGAHGEAIRILRGEMPFAPECGTEDTREINTAHLNLLPVHGHAFLTDEINGSKWRTGTVIDGCHGDVERQMAVRLPSVTAWGGYHLHHSRPDVDASIDAAFGETFGRSDTASGRTIRVQTEKHYADPVVVSFAVRNLLRINVLAAFMATFDAYINVDDNYTVALYGRPEMLAYYGFAAAALWNHLNPQTER